MIVQILHMMSYDDLLAFKSEIVGIYRNVQYAQRKLSEDQIDWLGYLYNLVCDELNQKQLERVS